MAHGMISVQYIHITYHIFNTHQPFGSIFCIKSIHTPVYGVQENSRVFTLLTFERSIKYVNILPFESIQESPGRIKMQLVTHQIDIVHSVAASAQHCASLPCECGLQSMNFTQNAVRRIHKE